MTDTPVHTWPLPLTLSTTKKIMHRWKKSSCSTKRYIHDTYHVYMVDEYHIMYKYHCVEEWSVEPEVQRQKVPLSHIQYFYARAVSVDEPKPPAVVTSLPNQFCYKSFFPSSSSSLWGALLPMKLKANGEHDGTEGSFEQQIALLRERLQKQEGDRSGH